MNVVNSDTPLDAILELFHRDGYVVMENALSPAQVAEISAAYDRELSAQLAASPLKPGALRAEVPRILERGAEFEPMMDHPPVFRVARAVIGADIELATSGELDYKLPRTPSFIGWHNDFAWMVNVPYPRQNFWVRCTYFLSDVTEENGPFTLLPGTHLLDHKCPDLRDENGQPLYQPGQIGITGKAGSCLINHTEIWHCNSANRSDAPRRLIMILYKHAWMKQWAGGDEDGSLGAYATTPEFAARQIDPVRRQLTGAYPWNHGADHFPANAL